MYETPQDIEPAFKGVIWGQLEDDSVTSDGPSRHLVNFSPEPEITAVIIEPYLITLSVCPSYW